jgi:transcription elongation factor Elf1
MPDLLEERHFDCPACGAPVSVLLDLSVPEQTYVEDCEVCCRPLEISVRADAGGEIVFSARQADR